MSKPERSVRGMEKTEKKTKAVAVTYNPEDVSPKIVGKGMGFVADKILEKADANDIPVYQDASLVEELTKIDLGDNIPPELYEVVAQVLLFVSDLDRIEEMRRHAK